MQALYRKYRPTKLADVIGQDQVIKPLSNALKNGKLSHAYLFSGPRGCGKTSVARIMAHEVNGFPYTIEDSYTDIIEIDAASNTGVDNIRDLIEKTIIAPAEGKYKVYIIDEVHMLSKSAFNALLKTLEEPPAHVIFIMATTDAYKVPITITSRSQIYNFQLAAPNVMLSHLKSIAEKEKIPIDDEALTQIVTRGGGSFRDSISLLDQISTLTSTNEKGIITKEIVCQTLGIPDEDLITRLLDEYQEHNTAAITRLLHDALDSGMKAEILASNLIRKIIDAPNSTLLPLLARLPEVKDPFPEAKIILAFLADSTTIAPHPPEIRKTTPQKPQPVAKPAPSEVPKPKDSTTNFSWNDFTTTIRSQNPTIAAILQKCQYDFYDHKLTIYPEKKIQKTILESDKNRAALLKCLPEETALEISENKKTNPATKNFSKISDIMGEVQEVNTDGVPF